MSTVRRQRNTTRWLMPAFYTVAVLIQVLVIAKVIPYDQVNGGMSESYDAQLVQSVASIVISVGLFMFVWAMMKRSHLQQWQRRTVYAVTVFWGLGLIGQLIGTEFERYYLSPMLLVGVIAHGMVLHQLPKSTKA